MNPVVLLLVGVMVFYGWSAFPPEQQALAWNIGGAIGRLSLLWYAVRGSLGIIVASWWTAEELLVIGCSGLYMVRPWEVKAGEAMCSSLLHYDLGTIGMLVIALIAWQIARHKST